ncbi:putative NADPH-cytochrome P450 reductase [Seiridium cardinale]|uniref:NADPH-cytochrome P450 reductase n=1 Tax=Seiridium cardinale TaxID=138064 RepID=A0ABR2XXS3_9PEZI
MFREEFIPNLRLRDYIQKMNHYIDLEISRIPEQEVEVGDWVFRCLLGALGKTIWGGENGPFHDQDFLSHLRPFLLNLRALNNPATYLIDKRLLESRRIVRDRLEKFTFEEYTEKCNGSLADGQKEGGFLGRIRSLCIRQGAPPEGWTDYQLLLIAGIGPNIVAASTWLIYHLLADKDRLTKVRDEIDRIVTDHQGAVDLADIPEACPLLYATWIEVLRFHGTFTLGRYVHEDTTLADTYLFQKGSYALAPLQQHHFEPEVWGDDVNEFRPERFIKCGKFDYETRKKVRVFGLFGTICPGRFLAANVALSLTIRLLSTFDVIVPGGDFILPEERKDSVVGLSPPEKDIVVGLSRRPLDYHINLTWKS